MRRVSPDPEVHIRVGPGLDVAACGARGHKLKFGQSLSTVGCSGCREKRTDSVARAEAKSKRGAVSAGIRRSGAIRHVDYHSTG